MVEFFLIRRGGNKMIRYKSIGGDWINSYIYSSSNATKIFNRLCDIFPGLVKSNER
jgi:hypothetical protein